MAVTGASTALRRVLDSRESAVRALRKVTPHVTARRLGRARTALLTAPVAADEIGRANTNYLRTALDLELELIRAIRAACITRANAVYHELIAHHGTADASRTALHSLPADVRAFGADPAAPAPSLLIFAIPFSVLGSHLTAALPHLCACRHGLLGTTGTCRTPPCPP